MLIVAQDQPDYSVVYVLRNHIASKFAYWGPESVRQPHSAQIHIQPLCHKIRQDLPALHLHFRQERIQVFQLDVGTRISKRRGRSEPISPGTTSSTL